MAKTKAQVKNCVGKLKVLADETRLRVIHEIIANPKSVNEINQVLKIEQSLLSHHLKILREAGLIISERKGQSVVYRTAPSVTFEKNQQTIDLGCCKLNFNEKSNVL